MGSCDWEHAGLPARALVERFIGCASSDAMRNRHTFSEAFASAILYPEAIGGFWEKDIQIYPLGYRMRALWRVLGCIYADTDINGEPANELGVIGGGGGGAYERTRAPF
jgi:hypothetical protein